jgi:hypothetical protein
MFSLKVEFLELSVGYFRRLARVLTLNVLDKSRYMAGLLKALWPHSIFKDTSLLVLHEHRA